MLGNAHACSAIPPIRSLTLKTIEAIFRYASESKWFRVILVFHSDSRRGSAPYFGQRTWAMPSTHGHDTCTANRFIEHLTVFNALHSVREWMHSANVCAAQRKCTHQDSMNFIAGPSRTIARSITASHCISTQISRFIECQTIKRRARA